MILKEVRQLLPSLHPRHQRTESVRQLSKPPIHPFALRTPGFAPSTLSVRCRRSQLLQGSKASAPRPSPHFQGRVPKRCAIASEPQSAPRRRGGGEGARSILNFEAEVAYRAGGRGARDQMLKSSPKLQTFLSLTVGTSLPTTATSISRSITGWIFPFYSPPTPTPPPPP